MGCTEFIHKMIPGSTREEAESEVEQTSKEEGLTGTDCGRRVGLSHSGTSPPEERL